MKIAYLHGLESKGIGEKNHFLRKNFNHVYDPKIDYTDPKIWDKIYSDLLKFRPDYIVGSSMGGWFAYNLGKKLGIPTLLFNPALHSRTLEPPIDTSGSKYPNHSLVLGKLDKVIDAFETRKLINKGLTKFKIYDEIIEHRIPFPVFQKYLLKIKKGEL